MKVSFIMQVYLGEYPGSRSNAIDKFHRAVNSLQSQTSNDWELIIVSDGCKITRQEYENHFTEYERIKFVYVEKPEGTEMYSQENGEKYFRGFPRQIGRALATGDWIGYVDADDFIINTGVEQIINYLNALKIAEAKLGKQVKFLINDKIIEHINATAIVKLQREKLGLVNGVKTIESDLFTIDGLPDEWFAAGTYGTTVSMGTAYIWHTQDFPPTKWKDVKSATQSEDNEFVGAVLKDPELNKFIGRMSIPYYVRCHYNKIWDV
jgi:glycosyltransferase involved in cell wall biosynthesis